MAEVIEESPYAAVVDSSCLDTVCSFCFTEQSAAPFSRCSKCKLLHYCSADCQKKDWKIHKYECKFLVEAAHLMMVSGMKATIIRMMGRLLIRKKKGHETKVKAFNGRTIDDLKRESEKRTRHYVEPDPLLLYMISQYVTDEFKMDNEELHMYYGILALNQSTINGVGKPFIGLGLYLGLSGLRHSCAPTARIVFREGRAILHCTTGGTEYNDQLTIAYIEPEWTTEARRKRLLKRFHFYCKCEACEDKEKDGYERSIKCKSCPDGLCLVTDDSTSLSCIKCGAISPVTVDEANRVNNEILRILKIMDDDMEEYKDSLNYFLGVYKRSAAFLSKRNVPLAYLAYRLTGDFNELQMFEISSKLAYSFPEALRSHLPPGCRALTYYLMVAVYAVCKQTHPGREANQLFKELKESVLITHGTLEEATKKGDKEAIWVHNTIASYDHKFKY